MVWVKCNVMIIYFNNLVVIQVVIRLWSLIQQLSKIMMMLNEGDWKPVLEVAVIAVSHTTHSIPCQFLTSTINDKEIATFPASFP